jgi:hypothetical protein
MGPDQDQTGSAELVTPIGGSERDFPDGKGSCSCVSEMMPTLGACHLLATGCPEVRALCAVAGARSS